MGGAVSYSGCYVFTFLVAYMKLFNRRTLLIVAVFTACMSAHFCGRADNACLQVTYTSQVGVKEATGHNDGVQVEAYLASVHLKKGNPWCAAFLAWCMDGCGVIHPVSGYCPDWFRGELVYKRSVSGSIENLQQGDVFGIWFENLGRIAHVGFGDRLSGEYVVTYEGNTNDQLSREGNGVF